MHSQIISNLLVFAIKLSFYDHLAGSSFAVSILYQAYIDSFLKTLTHQTEIQFTYEYTIQNSRYNAF